MSWNIHLCIGPGISLDAVAEKASQVLRLPLRTMKDGDETYFVMSGHDMLVEIQICVFENDRELNFEDFSSDIVVWRNGGRNPETTQDNIRRIGGCLFDAFKECGLYRLLLTEQVDVLMQRFDP